MYILERVNSYKCEFSQGGTNKPCLTYGGVCLTCIQVSVLGELTIHVSVVVQFYP